MTIGGLRPGQTVRLSSGSEHFNEPVTIWSPAPGPGCYWAHLPDNTLVHIQARRDTTEPNGLHVAIRTDLAP